MNTLIRKMKYNFYQKNITKRIIIVIMILSIISTITFVGSVFVILRSQLINRTKTSSEKDIAMVLEKMDMFIQSVRNDSVSVLIGESCQTLLSDSNTFLSAKSSVQYQKYKLMQKVITSNINQKTMYNTIVFYDVSGNVYTDDSAIVTVEELEQQKQRVSAFLKGHQNEKIVSTHKSPWRKKKMEESEDCISYLRKVYGKESGKLIGVVEFEITNKELISLCETVMVNGINIFFAYQGQVILSQESSYLYSNLNEEIWYQKLIKSEERKKFKVQKNRHGLYLQKKYEPLDWEVICVVPAAVYMKDIKVYALLDIIIGISLFLLSLGVINILIVSITKPLSKITNTIVNIGKGDYNQRVSVKDGGEIGTLASEFNKMLDKTKDLMEKIVKTEEEKRESELSLVQMQMTPHFFYNILESICGLIVMDEKKTAIHTINLLSGFYRGVLNKGREIIKIEQELKIVVNYLEIMKICYPEKFSYEIHCPEELNEKCINKLTLQPILENAIHHGFNGMATGGKLKISIFQDMVNLASENSVEARLILEVEDNGRGIEDDKLNEIQNDENKQFHMDSFGLRNTDERIKLYFGGAYGLIAVKQEKGTKIRIELPIIEVV